MKIRWNLFRLGALVAGLALLHTAGWSTVYYVDGQYGNDANDGKSWGKAVKTIKAGFGKFYPQGAYDELWVRKGVYRETWDAEGGYLLPARAGAIYGGFSGWETNSGERDTSSPWNTVLIAVDNPTGPKAAIIGTYYLKMSDMTIVGGRSEGQGGAIRMWGNGNLILINCIFYDNTAIQGGAVYMDSSGAIASNDCVFINNHAELEGGGVFENSNHSSGNNGGYKRVKFVGNTALSGGGIYFKRNNYDDIANTLFARNGAKSYGGAIFIQNGRPWISGTSIVENTAKKGGGLFLVGENSKEGIQSTPQIIGCIISDNTNFGIYGSGRTGDNTKFSNLPESLTYTLINNPSGELYSEYFGLLDDLASIEAINSKYSSNRKGNPQFYINSDQRIFAQISGAIYDSSIEQTVLALDQVDFRLEELKGQIVALGDIDKQYTVIVGNTSNTISVLGNHRKYGNGGGCEFMDYRIPNDSIARSSGSGFWLHAGNVDIRNIPRYDSNGWDMGAYEYGFGEIEPYITEIKVISATTIEVSYNIPMRNTTSTNFILSGSGKGTCIAYPDYVGIVDSKTHKLHWNTGEMKTGGDLNIIARGLESEEHRYPLLQPSTFSLPGAAIGTPPQFAAFTVKNSQNILLYFTEPMIGSTLTTNKISISGTGQGTLAAHPDRILPRDNRIYLVQWNTGSMIQGADIQLTLDNTITDLAGNALAEPYSISLQGVGVGAQPPSMICQTDLGEVWGIPLGPQSLGAPQKIGNLGFRHSAADGWQTFAGDFSGDHWTDVATVTPWGELWLSLNQQNGTFTEPAKLGTNFIYDLPNGWMNFAADINGDARCDVAEATEFGDIYIARNLPDEFQPLDLYLEGQLFHHPAIGRQMETGDFDGDGIEDLLMFDYNTKKVGIAFGAQNTLETFRYVDSGSDELFSNHYPVVGDFNGDLLDDICVIEDPEENVFVALSQGRDGFAAASSWAFKYGLETKPTRGQGWTVFAADVNNDGRDDLVQLTEYTDVWVAYSTGSSFQSPFQLGYAGFRNTPEGPWRTFVGRFVDQ